MWVDYDNMSLRVHRLLEENMILSNEPGIYFSDYLLKTLKEDEKCTDLVDWTVLEQYKKEVRGIRIEDNFIVKKDGSFKGNFVNMTAGLPKTVEDIEKWMADDKINMEEVLMHL